MAVVIVVGAQWGDEGKGKVVDHFAQYADVVVRYAGGANAGHTLVRGGVKTVTHLLPSAVLHPGVRCVLGDGMVIEPQVLLDEIAACRERGLLTEGELVVSSGAHVILPYHKMVEALRERGAHAIGTTKRGIGPAYEAKAGRRGIRLRDLVDESRVHALIEQNLDELGAVIEHLGGKKPSSVEVAGYVDEAVSAGRQLADYFGDCGAIADEAIRGGQNLLLEGAQGALLDIDHGTYPYVTSSSTTAAGACQGAGVGPTRIDRVVGITKAYCTRVGGGPFPSEMSDHEAESWRAAGGEFGATTGRPRRCGWLDVAALRRAVRINGIDQLAVTKLDILGGRGPIKVCTGYRTSAGRLDELPGDSRSLDELQPEYETLDGWEDCSHATSMAELPIAARAFLDRVSEWVGAEIGLVSIGPEREDTVMVSNPFAAIK